jgi:hypothetical protein
MKKNKSSNMRPSTQIVDIIVEADPTTKASSITSMTISNETSVISARRKTADPGSIAPKNKKSQRPALDHATLVDSISRVKTLRNDSMQHISNISQTSKAKILNILMMRMI